MRTMICYITIDTEYDFGFTRRNGLASRTDNLARSILGRTPTGNFGIEYQMDLLDRYGHKGIFFVDPMPALVWGPAAVADIVGRIERRGHDVQLHIHTEWLELAGDANPVGRVGTNIKDFTFEQQCTLLAYAKNILVAAGAPTPVAFRAGNYGASDDTLRALHAVGLQYDTSHCPGIGGSLCAIGLTRDDQDPVARCGVIEVPIGCIGDWGGRYRHAQVTALSASELRAAIRYGASHGYGYFTVVTHSFELLSRDRTRVNPFVRRRFEAMCRTLANTDGVKAGTYSAEPPEAGPFGDVVEHSRPAPFNPLRTGLRVAEQVLANARYGRR